jgi:hypothetical protein
MMNDKERTEMTVGYAEMRIFNQHRIDLGDCSYTVTSDVNNSIVVEYFEAFGTDIEHSTTLEKLYFSSKVEAIAVANAILKVAESL